MRELDEAQVPHSFVVRWSNGKWDSYIINKGVTAHCVIDDGNWKVLSLCADGTVHIASSEGTGYEQIDQSAEGPNIRRWMFDIRQIGQGIYGVGMLRMIYKRIGPERWFRFDQGIRFESLDELDTGLRSIDGFDENSIYAVGLHGEIWYYDRQVWRRIDSPTNLRLDAVRCVPPDRVYACGANGVIVCGHHDNWSVIEQEETKSNIWSVEYFQGKVYFADSKFLYEFDGSQFKKVDTGLQQPISTSYLHANDRILCSVGESDVAIYDGKRWELVRLPYPTK